MTDPSGEDLKARLDAARCAIVEHPGYKEHQALEALHLSLAGVFVPNWRILLAFLDAAATNEELAIELIQNARKPVVRERFQAETTRHLHNYLASVHSLVEHVRRMLRGRSGSIIEEFERRKAELLQDPEVKFIVELRNFTHHRILPFLGHTLSLTKVNTPDQQMESEIELSVGQLLEWDGWPALAREFLASQGDAIKLRPAVRRHGQLVFELNAWLLNELGHANDSALEEVNELVVRANMIFTGDRDRAERLARRTESTEPLDGVTASPPESTDG
jgi:extradiol dioxygenase family protein